MIEEIASNLTNRFSFSDISLKLLILHNQNRERNLIIYTGRMRMRVSTQSYGLEKV